jgi:palmitoyltransferase
MAGTIFHTLGVDGFITYYIFIMAFVMGVLLLCLCMWHGKLISRGETSVERMLNQNYQQNLDFAQIHRFSLVENWKRFFGIRNMREFVRRILLPSTHKPKGNGVLMNDFEINGNLIIR